MNFIFNRSHMTAASRIHNILRKIVLENLYLFKIQFTGNKGLISMRAMFAIVLIYGHSIVCAQHWKLEVNYRIDVALDHTNHRYQGTQLLTLVNHSPDTLKQLFFHLYNNAFRPGSEMDIRSRNIPDPDQRVDHRIGQLELSEQGYLKCKNLLIRGIAHRFQERSTILQVDSVIILPGEQLPIQILFEGQVPLQIRRNGRMNAEGVHYSMAQWYPKLCHYDHRGWHPNPYIGREFYGIFGTFDVYISMDSSYLIAGTGTLMNASDIGKGYSSLSRIPNKSKVQWHFSAENVHDFVWAADPEYIHLTDTTADGIILRAFYKLSDKTSEWPKLLNIMSKAFDFIQNKFGRYPYKEYSFIQGGDGGMEYPMATLITGHRSLESLVGVSVHELMHSWYQGVLGFNESYYHWMDEGFTTYASELVMQYLKEHGYLPSSNREKGLFLGSYMGYKNLVQSGIEEPMGTHADHFEYNAAYGLAAYSKGSLYLRQLCGIMGEELLDSTLRTFYKKYQFGHPTDFDFIRVAESVSGVQLRWYNDYWVYSTKWIDYQILEPIVNDKNRSVITIERLGKMPMPIQIEIELISEQKLRYFIPLDLMFYSGQNLPHLSSSLILPSWEWVNPNYQFDIPHDIKDLKSITIDPDFYLMDVVRENNRWSKD